MNEDEGGRLKGTGYFANLVTVGRAGLIFVLMEIGVSSCQGHEQQGR